ncbi:serine hydrolase domain-containing protein [Thermomonospora umbrina]|uniref:Beta-lactamase-related domain-containing protein n=1 Tax=Thermomonospora umbrina TaxID=111806 RepID=A0A3D9SH63_9ACTN|nr:serine hydrolase domain-containing protein [Thermomonospora umbrina]REE95239.1 hypothetical protein DFJ69_0622 [Thermomonospora umbrina]
MRRRSLSPALAAALAAALTVGVATAPAQAAPGVAVSRAAEPGDTIKFTGFDTVKPSSDPLALTDAPRDLNVTYTHNGQTRTLEEYLGRAAQGLVVLDGDKIVKEWYSGGTSKDTQFQSWSMSKSFTSAAFGIALEEGRIGSLEDTVGRYLPELASSPFGDVTLRDLLRMSSGINWNEVVDAPLMQAQVIAGVSTLSVAARTSRGWAPGSRFNYSGINTAVLAAVLAKATGVPYHRYIEDKLWGPAGMADTVDIANDRNGHSLGYCCYHAGVRDYARFGLLMLNDGRAKGRQVVPASWVSASVAPSGVVPDYGLHWWIDGTEGYYASGLAGQIIYVSVKHRVVIAKSTLVSLDESDTLAAMRAIAAEVARTR